jgi:hypothetical protein
MTEVPDIRFCSIHLEHNEAHGGKVHARSRITLNDCTVNVFCPLQHTRQLICTWSGPGQSPCCEWGPV